MSRSIMWFRRDLRLADHPALLAAGSDGHEVVPVFVVDPTFAEAGAPRLAYLHDVLTSLDQSIRERSESQLLICHGEPTNVIGRLAEQLDADTVFVTKDYSPYGRRRDEAVAGTLASTGRQLRGVGSPYATEPGSVRKDDATPYKVFTPYSKVWRRTGWDGPYDEPSEDFRWVGASEIGGHVEPMFERPTLDVQLPVAGEPAAFDRWSGFLESDVQSYKQRRDRPDMSGTSKLSPDLKWGVIHPRTLLADLDITGGNDEGPTVFASELAWRDFYADVLFVNPRSAWKNLNAKYDAMPVDTDDDARKRFDRWASGTTGFGIVDAGMRQLLATGWMHNRVRMIVASFLVKDLHLPWQWGARWFMQHLIDGDIASNNHGWQWAAGTGTDAAPYFRVFNPTTQMERYDPKGEYVRQWVDSPVEPMIDHAAERLEALRRLKTLAPS